MADGAEDVLARRRLHYSIGAAAFVALFVAWTRLHWFGPTATRTFADLTSTAIPLAVGALILFDARRLTKHWRSVWFFMGLGCLAWGSGNAVWAYLELVVKEEVPFPSWADAGYVLLLPLMGIALFRLVKAERQVGQPLRGLPVNLRTWHLLVHSRALVVW